jgi:hypothetical protein
MPSRYMSFFALHEEVFELVWPVLDRFNLTATGYLRSDGNKIYVSSLRSDGVQSYRYQEGYPRMQLLIHQKSEMPPNDVNTISKAWIPCIIANLGECKYDGASRYLEVSSIGTKSEEITEIGGVTCLDVCSMLIANMKRRMFHPMKMSTAGVIGERTHNVYYSAGAERFYRDGGNLYWLGTRLQMWHPA